MENSILRGKRNRYLKICDMCSDDFIQGKGFPIYGVSDSEDPISNTIIYVKKDFNDDVCINECIIISKNKVNANDSNIQIIVENPKSVYADILNVIKQKNYYDDIFFENGSYINKRSFIGNNTKIGRFCVVEDDVIIGRNCDISDYVYIGAHTRIGDNVIIKERCSIGVCDADIYRDGDRCLTLPHLGGTIIEDGCLFLNNAHVASGDTKATVIGQGSMIGISATVGHNSHIGKNTLVGAHTCICGHCEIGEGSYIAPMATIMNRLHVGNNSKVGLGAVVLNDVKEGTDVFGNPAITYWKKK